MTIFLWALGVLLIFGGFVWWNHRGADVVEPKRTMARAAHVPFKRTAPPKKKARTKPRRKGYAGHGRIPRTGGWY